MGPKGGPTEFCRSLARPLERAMKGLVGRWKRIGTGSGAWAGFARFLTYALLLFFALELHYCRLQMAGAGGTRDPHHYFGVRDSRHIGIGARHPGSHVCLDAGDRKICLLAVFHGFRRGSGSGPAGRQDRSCLHADPAVGRDLCFCDPIPRLHSNHPAFAQASCAAASRR